ncbi:exodeoxyribonuclease VII large subunit [Variovorax ginsengisoli]|uniref:Exodeoxyribonuclease 7 large subunit n=1 Tax=Variovorax ginsengisoli TaxID=363844 RepID=A0ABT9S3Q5_9BURK|nr:exodeoxyribonuclease VII large subunit [Variovorax ginsengisoli]MDP9898971.1 exodeoxyribonuclease VII large subunit [Variovorax ginsengisoli]
MSTRAFSSMPGPRVWAVGALCHAVADALEARFNPVTVAGEISGFSRASSGHCYFSLKDDTGQLRSAMFRRAASLLDFTPRDGDQVEVRGRLAVYEPRGDLQLIVESLRRAGQGALFEQFLQRKAKLEAEGLFDVQRKRELPVMPRAIGLVTSLGAAALHDVVTALRRRAPHIPVVLAPAAVQGAGAPGELVQALRALYALGRTDGALETPVDVILLVRGGGSIEDLWAFNDETLARTIVQSPVPVVSGVGHETDFTIADFCADLRAPTPTAAAELVSATRELWLGALDLIGQRLDDALGHRIDQLSQRLDLAAGRLGRPSSMVGRQQMRLAHHAQRLRYGMRARLERAVRAQSELAVALPAALERDSARRADRLDRVESRLRLLDPALVLQRGYAWLTDPQGRAITQAAALRPGDRVVARLADGAAALTVDAAATPSRKARSAPTPRVRPTQGE